jgi:KipI family sensor histidine kinase inhibitor
MAVRFLPAGDRGLVVQFGTQVDVAINDQVRALALTLEAARIPGLLEVVPTYRSLGVQYDPARLGVDDLRTQIEAALANLDPGQLPPPRVVHLPTCYGGEFGPDLSFVVEHSGLSEAEVIALHSQTPYHVHMIGFTAGFAYLGGLPETLHTPRLPSPRTKTPRGAVGIGGSQTGAYSAETPGGWRLIGRTPVPLFDPLREPPTPMLPGDTVRFDPISREEYDRLEQEYQKAASSGQQADGQLGDQVTGQLGSVQSPSQTEGQAGNQAIGQRGKPESPSRLSAVSAQAGPVAQSPLTSREALEILRAGLLTTVQDRGRIGCQKFGVTMSGAMDEVALRVGNLLVGNPQGSAGLEISFLGPRIRFRVDVVLVLTGAEMDVDLDGRPVPWYEALLVHAGQILDIRHCLRGMRAYLAVGGGIDVPLRLGSRSTSLAAGFGGLDGRPLRDGDLLSAGPAVGPAPRWEGRTVPRSWRPAFGSPQTVRMVFGPQDDAFTEAGRRTFLETTYEVSPSSDRMGCRLEGPAIEHIGPADIISDWIPPGGVQVPGNGKPIVLLADRQTTGGYTKIATVIGPDIAKIAQLRPGEGVRFQAVSVAEAQAAARALERELGALDAEVTDLTLWGEGMGMGAIC